MAPPDNSPGALVVEDEVFIAWGKIRQFLADLTGSALTAAMIAERTSKDGLLVVTAGRV
jgi:hypothetical protein